MPAIDGFLRSQEKIYGEFRRLSTKVKENGIVADNFLVGRRGGFFVSIVHSPVFLARAEALSRLIASVVPAIIYDSNAIHTTLGCYKPEMGFVAKVGEPAFENDLVVFTNAVREALAGFDDRDPVAIEYDTCLYSEKVVIAAGRPNQKFVDLVYAIQDAGAKNNIEIRPPWGAHATVNRFTANVPPEQLREFFEIMDGKPDLGKSIASGVGVGYSYWKSEEENRRENLCGHFFPATHFPF